MNTREMIILEAKTKIPRYDGEAYSFSGGRMSI